MAHGWLNLLIQKFPTSETIEPNHICSIDNRFDVLNKEVAKEVARVKSASISELHKVRNQGLFENKQFPVTDAKY